jgi:hypothetical protein
MCESTTSQVTVKHFSLPAETCGLVALKENPTPEFLWLDYVWNTLADKVLSKTSGHLPLLLSDKTIRCRANYRAGNRSYPEKP